MCCRRRVFLTLWSRRKTCTTHKIRMPTGCSRNGATRTAYIRWSTNFWLALEECASRHRNGMPRTYAHPRMCEDVCSKYNLHSLSEPTNRQTILCSGLYSLGCVLVNSTELHDAGESFNFPQICIAICGALFSRWHITSVWKMCMQSCKMLRGTYVHICLLLCL